MAAVSDGRHLPRPRPTLAADNGMDGGARVPRVLRRAESALSRLKSGQLRRWVLIAAALLFLIISVLSFASLPKNVHFRWWILPIVVFVTTPLTVIANSAEYRLMGLINSHSIGWWAAARLTVVAGIANLLPLPGGVAVRTQALHRQGSTYRRALAANAAAGLTWVGVGCLIIAIFLVAGTASGLGITALIITALACLSGVWALLRRIANPHAASLFGKLLIVETLTVAVNAVRVYLAFKLIGLSADAVQSVALTAAHIIAAAVGIFPSGLGLRELLAAAIGSAVGLDATSSIAATASDRIASQLGIAVLCIPLLLLRRTPTDANSRRMPTADEETST